MPDISLSEPGRAIRRALIVAAATLLAGGLLAFRPSTAGQPLTEIFFFEQDFVVVVGMAACLAGLARLLPRRAGQAATLASRQSGIMAAGLCLAVAGAALVGHWLVFGGYALTRDEAMALFDAAILRSGDVLAGVPEAWRAFVPAMQPLFRFPVAGNAAWMSAYLPGNAALQAVGGAATSPILAGMSVWLVYLVARRLWPERPDAALVAALMLALSPQVIVTAMTPYAMSAHLALDLLWLWLFLRGGACGHAGAIATGFLATGLHQIAFHPLFVAPFIVQLWWRRRWRLAFAYTLSYSLIGLFWNAYFRIALAAHGLQAEAGGLDAPATIANLLHEFEWSGLDLMLKNILRFVSWNMIALLPLAGFGTVTLRRADPTLWALVAGIALTTAAVFVLQPYQGHGWGFRYWHGLVGSFALLATAGYMRAGGLAAADLTARRAIVVTGIASLLLLPLRAWQTREFASPYVRAAGVLARFQAQSLIIDRSDSMFVADLVRNDPFLRGGTRMFELTNLGADQVRQLCASGSVAIFGREQAKALGIREFPNPAEGQSKRQALRQAMSAADCGQPVQP